MKNSHFLLLACMLLSACAKKTYLADSNTLSHQIKAITDSTEHKTSLITDKTITFINRTIDTNIVVTGKALSGYLVRSHSLDKDTSAHFENDDLNLFLQIDRTGKATATAIPKVKTIKAKVFERIAVYNNLTREEKADVNVKSELAVKTSDTVKHTKKEVSGNTTFSFSLIIIILLVSVLIWITQKFTFLGKLLR
ncbi:hypothetical protein [Mucilaginibacter sp. HD30]